MALASEPNISSFKPQWPCFPVQSHWVASIGIIYPYLCPMHKDDVFSIFIPSYVKRVTSLYMWLHNKDILLSTYCFIHKPVHIFISLFLYINMLVFLYIFCMCKYCHFSIPLLSYANMGICLQNLHSCKHLYVLASGFPFLYSFLYASFKSWDTTTIVSKNPHCHKTRILC